MFWTVINTQPQAEVRAFNHLRWQGFECYAPKEKTTVIRRGRRETIIRFLFPRYLFVAIENTWHALTSTFGVTRLLMSGDQPARLPVGWVDTMRACERGGVVVLPKDRFAPGQRVQVTGGLFRGHFGLYQGMTNRQREVVLLDTLGRVELAPGDLD